MNAAGGYHARANLRFAANTTAEERQRIFIAEVTTEIQAATLEHNFQLVVALTINLTHHVQELGRLLGKFV